MLLPVVMPMPACFGDYATIRQTPRTAADPGNLFNAFGYGLNRAAPSSRTDIHYVVFGRPAAQCRGR
jgi:hypothetical protein